MKGLPVSAPILLLSGRLNGYFTDIGRRAQELFDTIVRQMAHAQGVTETLKAAGQMAWAGKMNDFRASAMEIVNGEIIYA